VTATMGTAADSRDQYIPLRKADIIAAILADGGLHGEETDDFRVLARMLASIFHYEYHARLEALRDAYFFFQPDREAPALAPGQRAQAYAELTSAFAQIMLAANFVEVTREEIAEAERTEALIHVQTKTTAEDFAEVRFFRRGRRRETGVRRTWWGLRKTQVEFDVYDNVIVFIALKDTLSPRHSRRGQLKPGSVIIKYFRDIPKPDLNMLFPNVKVVMSLVDKLVIGVPALAGGIPILINLIPAFAVLLAVASAYLGYEGAVEDDAMKQALAALGALAALAGFVMRQKMKYDRQSLKYQKDLTEHVYFRNVNNNAGIFDYIIGAAEEQETKEAFLAYYALHAAHAPLARDELDRAIEVWLKSRFGLDVDFEIGDALAKLERLGLLREEGGGLRVIGLKDALAVLDARWDGFYDFAPQPPAPAI